MKKKSKVKISYGAPIRLKPSRAHKSKKLYSRKKGKTEIKYLIKTIPS